MRSGWGRSLKPVQPGLVDVTVASGVASGDLSAVSARKTLDPTLDPLDKAFRKGAAEEGAGARGEAEGQLVKKQARAAKKPSTKSRK